MVSRKRLCIRRFGWFPGLLILLVLLPLVSAATRPASGEPAVLHQASVLAGRCRLVEVDSVYFMDGGRRGWYLYVGGLQRWANMDVSLDHRSLKGGTLTLEVVGCSLNFLVLPLRTPYVAELPLREVPGARRVKIIGANGYVRRDVPGR